MPPFPFGPGKDTEWEPAVDPGPAGYHAAARSWAETSVPDAAPPSNPRVVRAWCFYDFGNSAFAVLFPAIFGAWFSGTLVGGETGDMRWGQVISLSMFLVAFSSPFLGGIADHGGFRKRMLVVYTVLGIACVLAFTVADHAPMAVVFLVAMIANVAFEGGMVFYNAYLPDIAPPHEHGRVSAKGFALGYAGSLVALGLAVVSVSVFEWLPGVWIGLALQWALAALYAFRVLPDDPPASKSFWEAGVHGLRATGDTIRRVWQHTPLRWFLIAYFFYMDGVLTVVHFAAIYAKKTLAFSQTELIGLIALVQVTALVGALAMAGPTDRRGPKWAVRVLLCWWLGVVVAAYFATSKEVFFGVAGLAGLGLGSIQSVSRAFMAQLIPPGREAEMFGFYALCGKSGAILGPLVFGYVSMAFHGNQRPAVLSVAAFYAAGLILLSKVNVPEPPPAPQAEPAQRG